VPLINALDGTLNAHGLSELLGIPEEHVARGLQLLADRGLLETS
jgi:DNA-binding IclR family transcriptional regulator